MAEEIKISVGAAIPGFVQEAINGNGSSLRNELPASVVVRGRNVKTGMPEEVLVGSNEVAEAMSSSLNSIVEAVTDTIDDTPPELVADLMANGITLAGGGSLLPGFDMLLHQRTNMEIRIAEDPLGCVVRGAGRALGDVEVLRRVTVDLQTGRRARR
jgi:rod shape-determining protein MreB